MSKSGEKSTDVGAAKTGFNTSGFVHASLGRIEEVSGQLVGEEPWQGYVKQIGTVRFSWPTMTVYLRNREVEIKLSKGREMREIRKRCERIESGALPLVLLQRPKGAAAHDAEVRVKFIFAAEQRHFQEGLCFEVPPDIATKAGWTGDPGKFPEALMQSLAIRTSKGWVMVARSIGLLGGPEDLAGKPVEFLNSEGDSVDCEVRQMATGGWLRIVDYRPNRFKKPGNDEKGWRDWSEKAIRLFGFEQAPRTRVDERETGPLHVLEALSGRNSAFLACWTRYIQFLEEMRKSLHDARGSVPLVFHSGNVDPNDPGCHLIHISNWAFAREHWGEVKAVDVFVASAESEMATESGRCRAVLEEVRPQGDARIRWQGAGGMPLRQGLIKVGDRFDLGGKRQKEAIIRIQTGGSAMDSLASLLNDPALAEPPMEKGVKLFGGDAFDESQMEAVKKAVWNQSLVAIQGPPGTGKTRVIVEIVSQLHKRSLKNTAKEGGGEFRVLVASPQNVAVFNAVDLLKAKGLFVDQRLSVEARKAPENAARVRDLTAEGRNMASRLGSLIQGDPSLREHASRSRQLDMMFRELTQVSGVSDGGDAVADLLRKWADPDGGASVDLAQLALRNLRKWEELPVNLPPLPAGSIPTEGLDIAVDRIKAITSMESLSQCLDQTESFFDAAGFAAEFEELVEQRKVAARAERAGDTDRLAEVLQKVRTIAEDMAARSRGAPTQEGLCGTGKSEKARHNLLRQLESEMDQHWQVLGKHAGGVLERWKCALAERPNLWKRLAEEYSELRGATCQMAGSAGRDDILNSYDLVIIDEAARADLGDLLIPMSLGKTILLVGDQNQLPPYVDDLAARELERENTPYLKMLRERSFFQELYEALPEANRTMLNRQYRCHPVIGQAISNAFYGRSLLSGPENPDAYQKWAFTKHPAWGIGHDSPLCWFNTDGLTNAICKTVNQEETRIAKMILERVFAAGERNAQQVGLITFYRDQMHSVAAMLEECFPEYRRLVELGTVDSFQGKEFPLVVLLTSRHDPGRGRAGFLSLPNRVNVAVSRAQRQLVIIGSKRTLLHPEGGSTPFKDFVKAAGINLKEISP